MAGLDGHAVEAIYTPAEAAAMRGMRAAGVTGDELRLIHEAKTVFDAQLLPEPHDPEPPMCHLCQRAGGSLVEAGGLLWCGPGLLREIWCRHRARMRLGIPGDESIRIVAAELPPEYARELESEEYGDDGKRVSSEAVREALAFLEQLRRDEPALVQWLLDGHPNLSEDEHLRRFGEPYQSRRRGGRA